MTKLYCIKQNDVPRYIGRTEKRVETRLEEHVAQSADLLTEKDRFIFEHYKELTIHELCETDVRSASDDETFLIWALHQLGKDLDFTTYNTTGGKGYEPIDKLVMLPSPTLRTRDAAIELCGGVLPKFTPWNGKMVEKDVTRLMSVEVVSNTNATRSAGCRYHSGGKTTPNIKFRWLNSNRPGDRYLTGGFEFIDTHHACVEWKAGERYEVWTKQKAAPDGEAIWCWEDQVKVNNSFETQFARCQARAENLIKLPLTNKAVQHELDETFKRMNQLEEILRDRN